MSYALLADGTVRAWGGGANGELGNGSLTARQTRPVSVSGLSGVVALAGGRNHAVALRSDGTIMTWGLNTSGQLGDGTKTSRSTPVQVSGVSTAVAVAAGADHSVALLSDGRVLTWGEAGRGQLGNGSTTDRTTPVQVTGLPAVVSLGCGRDHTHVVTSAGELWAWGQNDYGQLGDGTTTRRTRPVRVPGITDAVEFSGAGATPCSGATPPEGFGRGDDRLRRHRDPSRPVVPSRRARVVVGTRWRSHSAGARGGWTPPTRRRVNVSTGCRRRGSAMRT